MAYPDQIDSNLTIPPLSEGSAQGTKIYSNTGSPPSDLGSDGDFYIRLNASRDFYGPKDAGSWGSPISLVGPQAPFTVSTFAFDANADQNLSEALSESNILRITNGTISTTRKITSFFAPNAGYMIRICNYNSQDVQFAWSTGSAFTIPNNTWADIIGDGTNAVSVGEGTLTGAGP